MNDTPRTDTPKITVFVWPDGTWCYQEELSEMLEFMSDDYETRLWDDELDN